MRVLFDAERLRNPNSGLGQLSRLLGGAIVRHRPAEARLTMLVREREVGAFGPDVEYLRASWWRRFVATGRFDVWHATHQDSIFRPPRDARVILTIADLNFLERADYNDAKKARRVAALQRRVNRASLLTTISEYGASVVRQHLHVGERPIRVIYPGNPMASADAPPAPPAQHPVLGALTARPRPFFLLVGVVHPKKNAQTLLPMMREFPDHTLVLAGPDGTAHAAELRRRVAELGMNDRVLISGAVSEETKQWLYEQCAALLFPSLSEGFGLPVVEAMSVGKPVFLSTLTSLPEVGGDDAFYFPSFDPAAMAETVRCGLALFAREPDRAERMRVRAQRFSWERAAEDYWAMYTSLAATPARRR